VLLTALRFGRKASLRVAAKRLLHTGWLRNRSLPSCSVLGAMATAWSGHVIAAFSACPRKAVSMAPMVFRILANPATGSFFQKRNDARTELTTSRRRSVACGGRNDDAESMTHPTGGTCGIIHLGRAIPVHDSIRDGANRIDARGGQPRRPQARRLPQPAHLVGHFRTCTLAHYVAFFYLESFQNICAGNNWHLTGV
jgi:hypothetical protein